MYTHTIDDEMATHQHLDIPCSDVSVKKVVDEVSNEIGIAASGIEPMDAPIQAEQQGGEISQNSPGNGTRDSATEHGIAPSAIWPWAIPRNYGMAVATVLLAVTGIIAGQVIGSINNRTKATSSDIARRLGSSTPPTTEHNATIASQAKRASVALH